MKKLAIIPLCCYFIIFSFQANAQAISKLIEEKFRYSSNGDSSLLYHKTSKYDSLGRLMNREEFHYNMSPAGSLAKELSLIYSVDKKLLTESSTVYLPNGKKEFENYRTQYLVYAAKQEDSKYAWKQYIDNTLDIVKEDTLTYDKNGNLIKRCDYNYRYNTSLECAEYEYNNDNSIRRWRVYTYWTTVKAGGKIVDKRDKRQDYKYYYNSKGQPTKTRGKRYATQYFEDWSYNKEGQLNRYTQRFVRKRKYTKKKRKETGKKFDIEENILLQEFNNKGKLTLEIYTQDEIEQQKTIYIYEQDSIELRQEVFLKGLKHMIVEWSYDEQKNLKTKTTRQHDKEGEERLIVITHYNKQGQVLSESQQGKLSHLGKTLYEYNSRGDKILETIFNKNDRVLEKIQYLYEYR